MVDAIRPGVDPAAQIAHSLESPLLKQLNRLHATRSHLAESHNLLSGAELVQTPGQLRQGNEVSPNVGNLVFEFIAYIEQKQVFTLIETALKLFGLDFWDTHLGHFSFFGSKNKTRQPDHPLAAGR